MLRRGWDAVIVGAGHNGLTCAAYLARAGMRVLVLEARDRIGGACTLERPFDDTGYVISPCAYVVGLLHPLVVEELALRSHGYAVHPIDPHLWCPFDDGSSLTLWDDSARNRAEVAAISPRDVDGFARYEHLFARIRQALRAPGHDVWVGDAPSRAQLESLLGHDPELIEVLFHEPIASVVERHVRDERLRTALHGQGLIGTWAGPRDAGTAAIHAMHSMGTLDGRAGGWGFVHGGMGNISMALAAAAEASGAVILRGTPVAAIVPGDGVQLDDGTRVRATRVVSNADPRTTLELCGEHAGRDFRERVDGWRMRGPVIKVNCALSRLPRFTAARDDVAPQQAMVTIARSVDATQAAFEASRRGEPAPHWAELYFHTAYDSSVAPPGRHVMSVFAQYAPYDLARGSWDDIRERVADAALAEVARFAPDVAACILKRQVLAPPDIEAHVGLRGGHIFQGECLPEQMWEKRFTPRTAMPGVYMCGAATHPGGSVIAVNGRNAAMALLADNASGQSMTASASISSR
ncbi:MAG: NAD(P)/FAD-dependent oxidoreductase [Candidatus Dormibacteraeota bacterium]|nr:NAD(P)/FAD-dependent oxidoreductase [Candidatus Dormibacteraeota bacterium]